MRNLRLDLLMGLLSGGLMSSGVVAGEPAPIRFMDPTPAALRPDEAQVLYLAPGVITSVRFDTKLPIGQISMGEPIAGFKYLKAERRLDLWPVVQVGSTNIQVPIGDHNYCIIVQIGQHDPTGRETLVQAVRRYSVAGEADTEDLQRIAAAPVIPPNAIRVGDYVRAVERAESDGVYRATLPDFRSYPQTGKSYDWNSSFVTLTNVYAFVDSDVIVLKVAFRNDSDAVIRFFGTQIGLKVRGKDIPVQVVYQRSAALEPECAIKPGEVDTCYLVLQGQKLGPRNPFELVLPPDAAAIEAWNRRKINQGM